MSNCQNIQCVSRCITYDGEAGQLRSGMDMIEVKYRWQKLKIFENEDDILKKEHNKGGPTESSMLWIKVLCDSKAKDHDEILK